MSKIKPVYIAAGAILLIFLMFSTCSGRPDAGDAEDDLSERIDAESNGTITLIEFEKTNAIERQAFGQESYTIQFKAKVRFEKECYIYLNKTGIGPLFTSFKTHLTKPEFIPSFGSVLYHVDKGEEVEFRDKVTYFETEEGWIKSAEPRFF